VDASPWDPDVNKTDVGLLPQRHVDRRLRVRRFGKDGKSLALEQPPDPGPDQGLVLDQDHADLFAHTRIIDREAHGGCHT
jgi:hypothetical protein